METFYDGDLKDIWDSDLDPTESLKISTDTDLHDWFLERDIKDPAVILNDKLISDALLNGTLPIKTEHSYSLNSDGDSLPDSPRSLQTKMDDMEDECYPAISLKTATSNLRHHHHHHHHGHALHHADTAATIDPKCLTISTSPPTTTAAAIAMHCSPVAVTSLAINNNSLLTTTPASTSGFSASYAAGAAGAASTTTATSLTFHHSHHHNHHHNNNNNNNNHSHNSIYASLNKITASAPMTFNLRNLDNSNNNNNNNSNHNIGGGATTITFVKNTTTIQAQSQQQQQQQQQYLPQQHISSMDSESICDSPISTRDGSTSPDICSDIEIDESFIKDEPMSPDSSCPPSPNTTNAKAKGGGGSTLSLSMANMAQYTNSDLVFEHKNGCLQLTPASHSLLKSQQLLLSSTSSNSQNIIIPKFNIKNETTTLPNGTYINGTTPAKHNNNGAGTYGLPLTPPSSSPSDESEGNLTPEHLLSPLSPNTSVSISVATAAASGGPAIVTTTARRSTSSSSSSSSSNNSNCLGAGSGRNINGGGGGGGANAGGGGSTRQPIHTPLISSQPKGSTGTLILTEEEKRTLLAEGYPIPQKLPLTKAEEKSLKKIRRKIKNKISAQESRRKKKEYMDQLERRVEILVNENKDYRKRVETLEDSNSNLLSQLHKLQALVSKQNMKK